MNAMTEKVIETVLGADVSVTSDQCDAVMAILNGRIPKQWPPLRDLLERNQVSLSSSGQNPSSQKTYLRRHEAAKYLGCSLRQIDSLKHDGDLPFHRLGRRLIVFKAQDLDVLMKKHRIDVTEMPDP
ncbi:MAG: excisionase family DNA-binding protein [bacterium]